MKCDSTDFFISRVVKISVGDTYITYTSSNIIRFFGYAKK